MRWTEESPRVPLDRLPLVVGRASECDLRLRHTTVSRRHARLFAREGQLVVADLDSRFGTFVNGQQVRERALALKDQLRFGPYISYVVLADALEREWASAGSLEVEGLSIRRQGRLLLAGVSAHLEPGNLVGILGPSGLGKTLLLRALAGYYPWDNGEVRFGGSNIWKDRESYLAHVGFIPQADVLYESLCLEENLDYAAQVRLPGLDPLARRQVVSEVLELLQLGEHKGKPVAVLSGGQRKRVSVAIELLRKPPVLLLDEPTTGLDAGNEARLVENLRQVARRGTVVAMSTHSLSGLQLFDRVLVLARCQGVGRQVYFGPPEGLQERWPGTHPADWYDLLERGGLGAETEQSGEPPVLAENAAPPASGTPPGTPAGLPLRLVFPVRQVARRQAAAGFLREWLHTTARCLKTTVRDRALLGMMALQPVLLGLLVILSQYAASALHSVLFFSAVVAVWLGMNNTVRDLVRERRQYIRDRMAGLRADTYLAAKVALFLAIGVIQLAVFVGLVRWGCGRTLTEHLAHRLADVGLLGWLAVLLVVYLCGMGLGMAVSTLARTEEVAVAALPMLILPQILLSAVATGDAYVPWSQPRGFRPLVVTLASCFKGSEADRSDKKQDQFAQIGWVGKTTDGLSMLCYSRPALLVLTRPPVENPVPGYSEWIWWGDFLHLLILLLGTYAAMWRLFLSCENRWPALAGL
jgi:ABC-type multidrug transport system ATPase subunit